jgi:hypothetical protein
VSDLSQPYVDKAYREGQRAYKRGLPESANPYQPSGHPRDTTLDDAMHAAWWQGYEDETLAALPPHTPEEETTK